MVLRGEPGVGRSRSYGRRAVIVLMAGSAGFAIVSTNVVSNRPAVAASTFTYGEGNAQAQSLDMDIQDSGANINVFAGQSTASYQDGEANAAASNVDIPLSGLLGSLQICSQPPPSIPLPTPLDVNTGTNGNTEPISATNRSADGIDGSRSAQAIPGSQAQAQDELSGYNLPGIVQVVGAESDTHITANAEAMNRSATATSDISSISLLNGDLELKGLHWQVQQSVTGSDSRTGSRVATSSFSLNAISVGSVTIPVPSISDLRGAVTTANALLAPLGLSIRLPTPTVTSEGQGMSPLTIAVGGNKDLWGPVVAKLLGNATLDQLEQKGTGLLFDPVSCDELGGLLKDSGQLNQYWNFLGAAAPLVIGIFGQALGGSGEIDFEVGGVSTTIDDTYYAPITFGEAAPPSASTLGNTGSTPSSGLATVPTTPVAASAPPATTTTEPLATSAQSLTTTRTCDTTSPAGRPACWIGSAPLGAVITGGLVCGLFAIDEVYVRRRGRRRASEMVRE